MAIVGAACGDGGGAEPDAAPEVGCATDLVTGTTFDLDPDGGPTQIHADVAFDGRAVWVVYNLPDGEGDGGFDVFAVRVHCDGTRAGERVGVTTTTGRNDVDPAVAIGDGNAYVVWQADDNTGVDNLDIVYRAFRADGTPIMESDADLETSHEGEPVTGNAFFPDVAAGPDGAWAISGVRALPGAGTFQAFVQRLEAGGELDGEAINGHVEAGITHTSTSVTVGADGALLLAWLRTPEIDHDTVVHTALAPGADVVSPSPPAEALGGQTEQGPSYAAGAGEAYLAFGSSGDIALADGATFDDTAPTTTFGTAGRLDHTPTVAAAPGGGAVAWHRNVSGLDNEVLIRAFAYDGAAFTLGDQVEVATDAPPYPLALTHVQDEVYFLAWSEGTSPDFYLRGRFIRLPAP